MALQFRYACSLLFAGLLSLGLASACSSGDREENNDTGSSDTETASATPGCESDDFSDLFSPVNIMLLQDISLSMQDSSKWTNAQDALTTILERWSGPEFHFGYDLFPPLIGSTYAPSSFEFCDTTPSDPFMGEPGVTVDCDQHNQQSILELQGLIEPGGATPLWCAMNNFFDPTYAPSLSESDVPAYLVVISDGADLCGNKCWGPIISTDTDSGSDSDSDTDTDLVAATPADLALITASLREDMDLQTFVIGFGWDVSVEQLDAIAAAGGTDLSVFIRAHDKPALINAFETVLSSVRGCRFELDPLLLHPNPKLNNIYFGDDKLTLTTDCTGGRGWRWSDSSQSEFTLCSETCADYKNDAQLAVRATFGCVAQSID